MLDILTLTFSDPITLCLLPPERVLNFQQEQSFGPSLSLSLCGNSISNVLYHGLICLVGRSLLVSDGSYLTKILLPWSHLSHHSQ